jgi:enoyl-CoA hydratase/carnithine racemase
MSTLTMAPQFELYAGKYRHIKLTRRNGIVELKMHTEGGSLRWGALPHEELGYCFGELGNDVENKVIILTGEGEAFCREVDAGSFGELKPSAWPDMNREAKRLLNNLLDIEVPVVGAVNGPAHIHAELALLSNIVIAAEEATFQDAAHFTLGIVPGDGCHVIWPALLGPTRGSYFLLTGQILNAREAMAMGIVNEVLPRAQLMSRAWELAEQIAAQPVAARRYSRILLTQRMKQKLLEQLGHGLSVEALGILELPQN